MNKRILFMASLLAATVTQALAQAGPDNDFMRSIGKMYVVVAVIVVIFLGILVFLVYLERKLKNLENQNKQNE